MIRGVVTLGLLAILLGPRALAAQTYPDIRVIPRTLDRALLSRQATEREIRERFRIGFDEELHGQWKAAGAEFERILTLHPNEPQHSTAYYDLGLAQAQLRDYDAARAAFIAAIANDGDFIAARANLVSVDLLRNDLAAARRDADELIARAPLSARALYEHGVTALKAGDTHAALHDFGALLERDSSYATGRYDLALAEIKAGRFAQAERELRDALSLAPSFARARFALGVVELRQGRRTDARQAFDATARGTGDAVLRNLAVSMRDSLQN